ncbi:MAG: hypothetical protein N2595_03245 [bacterium]|nr:hypothetical protein [bacterium]
MKTLPPPFIARPLLRPVLLCSHFAALALDSSNDWAVAVLEYVPASPYPGFTNTHHALGPAARQTIGFVPGSVDHVLVFQPSVDVVSIGHGGWLSLLMGAPVVNEDDPIHPYGVDLIVYGNAFFTIRSGTYTFYASPWTYLHHEPAEIWVSADTTAWFRAVGVMADDLLPTQSVDINGAPSDYLRPVNPALYTNDWLDGTWSYTNTVLAYEGAGGGAGVDLSRLVTPEHTPTTLTYCIAVRLRDVSGSGRSAEVDAVARVADVPEPCVCSALAAGWLLCARRTLRPSLLP